MWRRPAECLGSPDGKHTSDDGACARCFRFPMETNTPDAESQPITIADLKRVARRAQTLTVESNVNWGNAWVMAILEEK